MGGGGKDAGKVVTLTPTFICSSEPPSLPPLCHDPKKIKGILPLSSHKTFTLAFDGEKGRATVLQIGCDVKDINKFRFLALFIFATVETRLIGQ